jgi:hypothetical protein
MVSWVAQDSEGLLAIDGWALGLIGFLAVVLSVAAFATGLLKPWPRGTIKVSASVVNVLFLVMIVVTGAWIVFGVAYARTQTGQLLYGGAAVLSGWSAFSVFWSQRPRPTL